MNKEVDWNIMNKEVDWNKKGITDEGALRAINKISIQSLMISITPYDMNYFLKNKGWEFGNGRNKICRNNTRRLHVY